MEPQKGARPPVVLVVNDQEWSARSLDSILGPNGYAVLSAYTGRQAIELARTTEPDAVILDWKMRDMGAIEVCRLLRSDAHCSPTVPVLITASSSPGRSERLEAFAAGAWEYFTQPVDGEALLLKLRTFVTAKREGDRLRDASLVDQETGLYSMQGLARRAREIGADAHRHRHPLACIAFAPASANGSESLSEAVIALVVERLGNVCRTSGRVSDAIGRLGQAEFAVVAPATDAGGAMRLIARLRAMLANLQVSVDGEARQVDIRAGYCAVPNFADSPVDAVEMLLRATSALRAETGASVGGITLGLDQPTPSIPRPSGSIPVS